MTQVDVRGRKFIAVGFFLGLVAFALVIVAALRRSAPPSRCAAGMVLLGPRCCGEGQRLEGQRCVGQPVKCAVGLDVTEAGCVASARIVPIGGGTLRIGAGDWEAQGQVVPQNIDVPSFAIDAYEVHEARYAACVATTACAKVELSGEPGRALAGVTLGDARRFCAWVGGGLPSAEQLAFAAAGQVGRRYAWGDTGAVCRRAAWGLVRGPCAEGASFPEVAGSHPDGASPDGVHDLAGNVAEWTTTSGADAALVDVRGGSFTDGAASALRSWHRRQLAAESRFPDVGFRCVYPLATAGGLR